MERNPRTFFLCRIRRNALCDMPGASNPHPLPVPHLHPSAIYALINLETADTVVFKRHQMTPIHTNKINTSQTEAES